jgi:hypothetical protein
MATIEIPNGISEKDAKEWMSILVERKVNAAVNSNPVIVAATEAAKVEIDTYRKAVGLAPKFEAVKAEPVKEEELLPKDLPQG